ncbi:hypothetical protein Hanom_Chr07g00624881 [Helianthus anomalus]
MERRHGVIGWGWYGVTFWKSHFSFSHTPSLPNTILELMTFQKANKSISCFKKLSQTCPECVCVVCCLLE